MRRTPVIVLALVLFFSVFASAQAPTGAFVSVGEELVYRVSYLNITLGEIRCLTEPFVDVNGKKMMKVKIFLNSHPNIPFISLHAVYESWMNPGATYSNKFTANTMTSDDKWDFDQYLFDYDQKSITMDKYHDKKKIATKTYNIKRKYNDGSSLLYAARALLLSKKSYVLPTVIMDDTVSTVINFQGKSEAAEIDAVEYPVKCLYFNGDANWTGVYGLTGRFEGWFSDDEARVPIKATMSLYVGAATIELKSWKRGSWQPPKAS